MKLKEACESSKRIEVDSLLKVMVEQHEAFTEEVMYIANKLLLYLSMLCHAYTYIESTEYLGYSWSTPSHV